MFINVNYVIQSALKCEHESWFPIEDFTIKTLEKLSEEAKKNNIGIKIITEESPYFNGTVVEVKKLEKTNSIPQAMKYYESKGGNYEKI